MSKSHLIAELLTYHVSIEIMISCIRLAFVGMGALALLMQKEGLSAIRKSQAIKIVGEHMNT